MFIEVEIKIKYPDEFKKSVRRTLNLAIWLFLYLFHIHYEVATSLLLLIYKPSDVEYCMHYDCRPWVSFGRIIDNR